MNYIKDKKKIFFSNLDKNIIVLSLIRIIRNRAFHWENLHKIREVNGKIYPRITTTYPKKDICRKTKIGIAPEKILTFLDDLIVSINNEIMKIYKDIEIRYKR
ncbi:hypothetical protein [Helicobacter brantae]|uniref:hypothetical protein n=1 Tax=Helicobacter brantae TaxID=375927 RepID=UPI001473E0CD|nr:hypothetical protein [Helicobacter brantae]